MKGRMWLGLLFVLLAFPAAAQITPSGAFTPGHTVRCANAVCTVVTDAGGATGATQFGSGYLTEIGITNTGTPFCINDALTTAQGGYHALCLGANALGGGLIAYNAFGGAAAKSLSLEVNGSTVTLPYVISGPQSALGIVPGSVGDGVTDNCSAISAAIIATPSSSPVLLFFGPGVYFTSCPAVISGHSVTIRGAGKSSTELRFGTVNGISITRAGEETADISDMSITTAGAATTVGVTMIYNPSGFTSRDVTQVNLSNLTLKGVSQATQSWSACFSFNQVNYVTADNVDCWGINGAAGTTGSAQAANTVTPYGWLIAGNQFPTDYKITNSHFQSVLYGIYADNLALEGLQLIDNTFVNVGVGVHWYTGPANQGRPQLLALGNNLNVYINAFDIVGINESIISKNLIYHSPGATSAGAMISLAGVGSVSVIDNEIESFVATATASTTGILVGTAIGYPIPASYLVTIKNNMIGAQAAASSFALGVSLVSGASQMIMGFNPCGFNVTVCSSDASAAAIGQQIAPGRDYIRVKLSNSQTITTGTLTAITWDTVSEQTIGWPQTVPSGSIVVPSSILRARCVAGIEFAADATGARLVQFVKNGSLIDGLPIINAAAAAGGAATDINLSSSIFIVSGGDTISVKVSQNSGGDLGLAPQLTWMECEGVQ